MEKITFSVWDYVVFGASLVCSLAIGMYYAFCGGKQKTTSEYLMANRKMSYGPVSLSVMVTFMSAISVLGMSAEIYSRGTEFCFLILGYILCFPIVVHIFIPVFYQLRITSVYEYLEMRFSYLVRTCGTAVYIFMMVVYMGVVLYTPALALNAVTDLNLWLVICVISAVCIVYTTLGGLKAVIWTDVFQAFIMFSSQLVIIVMGTLKVGGVGKVIDIGLKTEKLKAVSVNPSPFELHTMWTLSLGGAIMCINLYGTNQSAVQRYMSCKSQRHAQITAYLNLPLLIIYMIVNGFLGLVMYATYHCENPLATGAIAKRDQLLIYFVMDLLGGYPGLPGLFVACLFSAALSTISSCFNSLATVTMHDLIRPHISMNDRQATLWSKVIAAMYGVLCLLMSFIASYMGSVLIAALSIFGIVGGPLLGLFTFGILFRRGNSKGALAGFLAALLLIFWIGFGGIAYRISNASKPTYTLAHETCNITEHNETTPIINQTNFNNILYLNENFTIVSSQNNTDNPHTKELYTGISYVYKLSYLWYSGLSTLTVIVVGLLVSVCTGGSGNHVNEETLHPLLRKKKSWSLQNNGHVMKNIEIQLCEHKTDPLNTTLFDQKSEDDHL